VFLVIFDSRAGHGGLFIRAKATVLEGEAEVRHGYQALGVLKGKRYGVMGEFTPYFGSGPRRIYQATPQQFWVNASERDHVGAIIRDCRYEIKLEALLRTQ
jgi:hypothetical protein